MANELTVHSFVLQKNGIQPIGDPSFKQWQKAGEFIKNAHGAVQFWIGDWLNFGEQRWGEEYAQELENDYRYDYNTLQTAKWVARKIPLLRRRSELSFSHHREVADLEPEEQEEFLNKAIGDKLTRSDFRRVVRSYKLKVELPEVDTTQLPPKADFDAVQVVVDKAVDLMEAIDNFKLNVDQSAKDYLVSQLKKLAGMVGNFIIKYGAK